MSRPSGQPIGSPQKSSQAAHSRAAAVAHATSSESRRAAQSSLETAEFHLSQAARISVESNGRTVVPSRVSSTQFVKKLEVSNRQPSVSVQLQNVPNEAVVDTLAGLAQKQNEDEVDRQGSRRSREAQQYSSSQGILVEPLQGSIPVDPSVQLQASQNARSMKELLLSNHGSFNDLLLHGKPVGGGGVVAQGLGGKWKAYHAARDSMHGDRVYMLQTPNTEQKYSQPEIKTSRKGRKRVVHTEQRNVGVQVNVVMNEVLSSTDKAEMGVQTDAKETISVGVGNGNVHLDMKQMNAQEGFYSEMREMAASEEGLRKKVRQLTFQTQTNAANFAAKEDRWKVTENNYKAEIELLKKKIGKQLDEKNHEQRNVQFSQQEGGGAGSNEGFDARNAGLQNDASSNGSSRNSGGSSTHENTRDDVVGKIRNRKDRERFINEFHSATTTRPYSRVRSKSVSDAGELAQALHNVRGAMKEVRGEASVQDISNANPQADHVIVLDDEDDEEEQDRDSLVTGDDDDDDERVKEELKLRSSSSLSDRREIEHLQEQLHRMKNNNQQQLQQQHKASFLREQKRGESLNNSGAVDDGLQNKYLQHYGTRQLTEETLVGEGMVRSPRQESKKGRQLPVTGSTAVFRVEREAKATQRRERRKEEAAAAPGYIPPKTVPKKPVVNREERNQALMMRAMGKIETGQMNLHGTGSKKEKRMKKQSLERLTNSSSSSLQGGGQQFSSISRDPSLADLAEDNAEEDIRSQHSASQRAREQWSKRESRTDRVSANKQLDQKWEQRRKEEQERQQNVILRSVDESPSDDHTTPLDTLPHATVAASASSASESSILMQTRMRTADQKELTPVSDDTMMMMPLDEEFYDSRDDSGTTVSISLFNEQERHSHSFNNPNDPEQQHQSHSFSSDQDLLLPSAHHHHVFTGEDVEEQLEAQSPDVQTYLQASLEQSGLSVDISKELLDQLCLEDLENVPELDIEPKRKSIAVQFQLPFIFSPLSAKTFSQETIHNIPLHMQLNSKPRSKKHTPKSRK